MSDEAKPITIKNWQFVVSVLVYIILASIAFATVKVQTDQNAETIKEIKSDSVGRHEFEEMRDDLKARLTRIEDKLDEERRLRMLGEEYAAPRHK